MKRWLRSKPQLTGVFGSLLLGALGSLIATWVWERTGEPVEVVTKIGLFLIPHLLFILFVYADLQLKGVGKHFSGLRTIGVDIATGALILNIFVLLPKKVQPINWQNSPLGSDLLVATALLIVNCVVCWFCLREHHERLERYKGDLMELGSGSQAYTGPLGRLNDRQKMVFKKEYCTSVMAAVVFMCLVSLLWNADSTEAMVWFKPAISIGIGGSSTFWLLFWEKRTLEWDQVQKSRGDAIARLRDKNILDGKRFSTAEASDTIDALGRGTPEHRQQEIELLAEEGRISEETKEGLLNVSERVWRDWIYIREHK